MIEISLFVVSAVLTINYFIIMIGAIVGNEIKSPIPILHFLDIGSENVYVYFLALAYQIYFWSSYAGIFTQTN